MISLMANLLVGNPTSQFERSHPQINLRDDMSLIVGTYYVCHEEKQVEPSPGTDAILQHIFVTDGGCRYCLEHFSKTKDSVSRINQVI
jgi:hypothetical protein